MPANLNATSEDQETKLTVSEEVLSVSKRKVDSGRGVRVSKTVDSQPITINDTLTHDEIAVRHVAINRTLEKDETPPGTRYQGDTLIIPVFEEVLVVERRIKLKEELHITRNSRDEPFVQIDMLKSEKISVERFDELADTYQSTHTRRSTMEHTMIAVFDSRSDAQNAMNELLSAGFDRANVRLNEDTDNLSDTPNASGIRGDAEDDGFGSGIKHFFNDLFGNDADKPHKTKYQTAIERGHHALTVTSADDDEIERAADIVEKFNPIDIDEKAAEWTAASGSGTGSYVGGTMAASQNVQGGASMQTDKPVRDSDRDYAAGNVQGSNFAGSQQRDAGTTSIPVMKEQIKVGKREVERGGVRVFSRIVETPVEENVSLREEHVNVERRPVDQPLDSESAEAFKEQTIELRETNEEAVVQKTARVVEEVVISKEVTQRQQSINDTVRHTEVEVEQLGADTARNDTAYRNHWATNYGTSGKAYDNYAPAYSFGNEMATTYRGRQWNDVEGDVRSNWESRNAGSASTWEEFKSAIRHGWDNLTN